MIACIRKRKIIGGFQCNLIEGWSLVAFQAYEYFLHLVRVGDTAITFIS